MNKAVSLANNIIDKDSIKQGLVYIHRQASPSRKNNNTEEIDLLNWASHFNDLYKPKPNYNKCLTYLDII